MFVIPGLHTASGRFGDLDREILNLRQKLSALTREHIIGKQPPLLLHMQGPDLRSIPGTFAVDVQRFVKSRWPETAAEPIDRALINLARLSERGGRLLKNVSEDLDLLPVTSDLAGTESPPIRHVS